MSAPRREMNPRRVAKSVRTHQATMAALGNAAASNIGDLSHSQNHPDIDPSNPGRSTGRMTNSNQVYSGYSLWRKPKSVNLVGSVDQKIDKQRRKGLITQGEAATERGLASLKNPKDFHSPVKDNLESLEKKSKKDTLRAHVPTEDF